MQKLLLLLALTTSAIASHDGLFVGIIGGANHTTLEGDLNFNRNPKFNRTYQSKEKKTHGFSFGVLGGYGYTVNNIYLGVDLGIEIPSRAKLKDYDYVVHHAGVTHEQFTAKYQRGTVFSIAPRIGIGDSYMFYVKPGVELSKDKVVIESRVGDYLYSNSHNAVTFVPTIGVEKLFAKNNLLRVEYAYNLGSEGHTTNSYNVSKKIKYTCHSVKLAVVLKF